MASGMAVRACASLRSLVLAMPPAWLCARLVGDDGLEPPTLSV